MNKFGTLLFTNIGISSVVTALVGCVAMLCGLNTNLVAMFWMFFFITTYHDIWYLTKGE